eukprot:scaffold24984_cov157-Isochrysis_galbana.AAC.2
MPACSDKESEGQWATTGESTTQIACTAATRASRLDSEVAGVLFAPAMPEGSCGAQARGVLSGSVDSTSSSLHGIRVTRAHGERKTSS